MRASKKDSHTTVKYKNIFFFSFPSLSLIAIQARSILLIPLQNKMSNDTYDHGDAAWVSKIPLF